MSPWARIVYEEELAKMKAELVHLEYCHRDVWKQAELRDGIDYLERALDEEGEPK